MEMFNSKNMNAIVANRYKKRKNITLNFNGFIGCLTMFRLAQNLPYCIFLASIKFGIVQLV